MRPQQVLEQVEARCASDGLRLTPTRRRVLELVIAADGPVKAYDLLDRLKAEQPNAAPPTVYRALDFLLEHHFIHRLESLNAFVSCFHPRHRHDGQFLICDDCGEVTELPDRELAARLRDTARAAGFEPARQVLEIYGRCAACASASASAKH
ncbi:MAG: Fur family transcriptional regulator [Wenzhouxiangellaceae bacterium]|nr:Fur family transcriptional regulator [Wenzhouxiangellaceae bacterium]